MDIADQAEVVHHRRIWCSGRYKPAFYLTMLMYPCNKISFYDSGQKTMLTWKSVEKVRINVRISFSYCGYYRLIKEELEGSGLSIGLSVRLVL